MFFKVFLVCSTGAEGLKPTQNSFGNRENSEPAAPKFATVEPVPSSLIDGLFSFAPEQLLKLIMPANALKP